MKKQIWLIWLLVNNKLLKNFKRVELCGYAKPAPFILRPFAGFFNPYPYGCSVLCNHPADYEAKEVVRRARESWVSIMNIF